MYIESYIYTAQIYKDRKANRQKTDKDNSPPSTLNIFVWNTS